MLRGQVAERRAWYRGIEPYAWLVLAVVAMGWMFDTMDQSLFNLVRQTSLADILRGTVSSWSLNQAASQLGASMTAVFLVGWAVGGFVFGMLGDRIGRARTMAIAIVIYAAFTGLTGTTHTALWYGICRFLTAIGVGGEFAAGAALVAEVFPDRSRPFALGMLQALSAVGNMIAGVVTLLLSGLPQSWRWAYAVGALPALLVFVIRLLVREPGTWEKARVQAREQCLDIGSIRGLFRDPVLRKHTIAGTLLALAGVGGAWGAAFFLADLTGLALGGYHFSPAGMVRVKSYVFLTQQAGAFFGMFIFPLLSERIGRRPSLLVILAMAFLTLQGTFHYLHDLPSAYGWALVLGFSVHAPFSAFAVYFPELYPTRLRSTGIGFCYNGARLLAAVAPFALGSLARRFDVAGDPAAGLRTAASLVAFVYLAGLAGLALAPETRGRRLP